MVHWFIGIMVVREPVNSRVSGDHLLITTVMLGSNGVRVAKVGRVRRNTDRASDVIAPFWRRQICVHLRDLRTFCDGVGGWKSEIRNPKSPFTGPEARLRTRRRARRTRRVRAGYRPASRWRRRRRRTRGGARRARRRRGSAHTRLRRPTGRGRHRGPGGEESH